MPAPLTPTAFQERTGVSRETVDRLRSYEALLRKWQRAINLVGGATLVDVWRRHFLDSAQLARLAQREATWLDIGSGAGFPGLVLAILGVARVHLVESDQRKSAFLREVARETGTANVVFHVKRLEELVPGDVLDASVFTARGLGTPAEILEATRHLATARMTYLLLAGRRGREALTEARKTWTMHAEQFPSASDPTSWVLRLRGVSRNGVRST